MVAKSTGDAIVLQFADTYHEMRLERRNDGDGEWKVWTADGFVEDGEGVSPVNVKKNFVDSDLEDGLYQYRAANAEITGAQVKWDGSMWLRIGGEKYGWTFGNYTVPEGEWGEIATPDDIRYTWLWGVDFKAGNGASFTDEQIRYYIDAALERIERELDLCIKKTRFAACPDMRGLVKGEDYDKEESEHVFRRAISRRTYSLATDKRPIISASKCEIFSRLSNFKRDLLPFARIDKTKGVIDIYAMPPMPTDTAMGIEGSVGLYGTSDFSRNLSFCVDYEAGYESAAEVPRDLAEIVGKIAACSMLNIIGRGLMSGFSSSSLSMDGMSESFSSTQSATSAYYGADIKEYKDDIDNFFKQCKRKFGHVAIGCI